MSKLPTWAIILITALLLFGGLIAASSLMPDQTHADADKLKAIGQVSPLLFLGLGIPIGILEALFWTVGFIECGARFARSPLLGAVLGVLAYSVAFHWSGGIDAILVSGWIVLVLNASYVVLRQRSRRVAVLSTMAQKVAFFAVAAITLYPSGA